MKAIFTSIVAAGLFAAFAAAQPAPHYTITDVGTLGGPGTSSVAFQMNNAGWISGGSNLVPGGPQHAFVWLGHGPLIDLGTLEGSACPGCNSSGDGPNASGAVAVGSETSLTDPNDEDFCAFGTHAQCRGAIWNNGILKALPNLPGGNNATAFGINNHGEAVGFAENGMSDSSCLAGGTPFQVVQFEAVKWSANGAIQQLRPLPGDTVGYAFGINDSGQAIGSSGLCANTAIPPVPAGPHAVLWESDGTPRDLGNLGVPGFAVASSINNRGDVVGGALAPDGTIHAFLWTKQTGMQDLGGFPGAFLTSAVCCHTLSDSGQVVGFAIDGTTFASRAIVWEGKVPVDLNTLIPSDSGWYLQSTASVNNAGEIVGYGTFGGSTHAFLLKPR
jgi:probable HAF family extracellular repeat protein